MDVLVAGGHGKIAQHLLRLLDSTIVRPGSLKDVPGSGLVEVVTSQGRRGDVPREDVALTVLECLLEPLTIGKTFDLFEGETPVLEALLA